MSEVKILVIDDDPFIRDLLAKVLINEGYKVDTAEDGVKATEKISSEFYDVLITDLRMPEMDGMQLMYKALELQPDIDIIIITAYASIENAVEAIKRGAFDYIEKPFRLEKIRLVVKRALEQKFYKKEHERLKKEVERKYAFGNVIGKSEAMIKILDTAEHVAKFDISILILGASGTGKEIIAKAIHYNSHRKDEPFIALRCGAIPENLLEDELFGHVKGAFTGADYNREGRFKQAEGGTLFLDEIASMPPNLQVKLLRVLQEKEYSPLGSSSIYKANVRIIAATNVDIEKAVENKTFREDLYYRLNVVTIKIPLLKDRPEDIPILANYFLQSACEQYNLNRKILSKEVIKQFFNYDWPGNVRELENLMHQLAIMTANKEIIELDDLPPAYRKMSKGLTSSSDFFSSGLSFDEAINKYSRYLISEALKRSGGSKSAAANLLKMKRTTLIEKMKRLWDTSIIE